MDNIESVYEKFKDRSIVSEHMEIFSAKMEALRVGQAEKRMTAAELDSKLIRPSGWHMLTGMRMPNLVEVDVKGMRDLRIELSIHLHDVRKDGTPKSKSTKNGKADAMVPWYVKTTELIDTAFRAPTPEETNNGMVGQNTSVGPATALGLELSRWVGNHLPGTINDTTMDEVLHRHAIGDDMTAFFVKSYLYLMQINQMYSSNSKTFNVVDGYADGDILSVTRLEAVIQMQRSAAVYNVDSFSDYELAVLQLGSAEYPSILHHNDVGNSVYGNIYIEACDAAFITYDAYQTRRQENPVQGPEKFWRAMVQIANQCGQVQQLINAWECVQGWPIMMAKSIEFGVEQTEVVVIDCPPTRAVSTVLPEIAMFRPKLQVDNTNLMALSSILLLDAMTALEWCNMVHYATEQYGLLNDKLIAQKRLEDNLVAKSIMRDIGMYDMTRANYWRSAMQEKFGIVRSPHMYGFMRSVLNVYHRRFKCTIDINAKLDRAAVRKFTNVMVANWFPTKDAHDSTRQVNKTVEIDHWTWGMLSKNANQASQLATWMCVNGLMDNIVPMSGLGNIGKNALSTITKQGNDQLELLRGKYAPGYRQVAIGNHYVPRLGYETIVQGSFIFIHEYIGMFSPEQNYEKEKKYPTEEKKPRADWTLREESQKQLAREDVQPILVAKATGVGPNKSSNMLPRVASPKPTPFVTMGGGKARTATMSRFNDILKTMDKTEIAAPTYGVGPYEDMKPYKDDFQYGLLQIPGDGLCLAEAVNKALEHKGVVGVNMTEALRAYTGQHDWFDGDEGAKLLGEHRIGLNIVDVTGPEPNIYSFNTDEGQSDHVVTVQYSTNHYDAVVRLESDAKARVRTIPRKVQTRRVTFNEREQRIES